MNEVNRGSEPRRWWVLHHPEMGGWLPVGRTAGRQGSTHDGYHHRQHRTRRRTGCRPDAAPDAAAFGPLIAEINARGLLERRRLGYVRLIAADVALALATVAAMVLVGPSWWQLLLALPAAMVTTRFGFLGHDAGHKQIASSHRVNRLLGLVVGDLLVGMSYGWWTTKHNKHHAHPNDAERDPDVGTGVLAWTAEQADEKSGLARWFVRHQAFAFFPLLLLEAVNLKVASVLDLRRPGRPHARLEAVLITVHHVAYVALLLAVMTPVQALVFAVVHHALFGLHLGSAFAPNHKGMPMAQPGQRWTHLQRQVLTSRNVRGGPVTDWLLGGLNYQIEHHLFPSLPRPALREAQPVVRDYCRRVGLPYVEEGALASYRQALQHLDGVAH